MKALIKQPGSAWCIAISRQRKKKAEVLGFQLRTGTTIIQDYPKRLKK